MNRVGLSSDLQFGQIENVRLGLVSLDLNSGQTLTYGADPTETVMEGFWLPLRYIPGLPRLKKMDVSLSMGAPSATCRLNPP